MDTMEEVSPLSLIKLTSTFSLSLSLSLASLFYFVCMPAYLQLHTHIDIPIQ